LTFCKTEINSGYEVGILSSEFLKGFTGDQINLVMVAAAFNFKKWVREVVFGLKTKQMKVALEIFFFDVI